LSENTRSLADVSIIQAAAVGTSRTVELGISRESWTSSIHRGYENDAVEHVDGLTVEQILERTGLERVDVIKMDVEGCEVEILEHASAVHKADWLIFEFHQEHTRRDVWHLIDLLPEFEIVRIAGDTRQHPVVALRRRAGLDELVDVDDARDSVAAPTSASSARPSAAARLSRATQAFLDVG
jgi:Methyltransferase FkbM domain